VPETDPAAERAIAALITEFCRRVDAGEGDRVAELFIPDGSISAPHFAANGQTEIHEFYSKRAVPGARLTMHLCTNLAVSPVESGYAARAYSMVISGAPPAPFQGARITAGMSTDRIVFVDGEARFAERRLDIWFEGVLAAP
jgi:hypothetical protein